MPPTATAAETETEPPTSVGVNRLATYGLFAVIVASVANALVRVIVVAVLDVPAAFERFPLGWGPVIASTAIGAVGATIVYGLLTRFSKRPSRTFTIVAAVTLLVSFAGPVNMFLAPPPGFSGFPVTVFVTLLGMHVTAAVAIVSVLTRAPKTGVESS